MMATVFVDLKVLSGQIHNGAATAINDCEGNLYKGSAEPDLLLWTLVVLDSLMLRMTDQDQNERRDNASHVLPKNDGSTS